MNVIMSKGVVIPKKEVKNVNRTTGTDPVLHKRRLCAPILKIRPVIRAFAVVAVIAALSSCVTTMGPRHGEYIVSVINSGDAEKVSEILSTPFLVDDILVTAPGDAVSYLTDLVGSIGMLPEQPFTEVPVSKAVQPGNMELKTFLSSVYPENRIVYEVDHPKGTMFLLIAKGEDGIKLYGIVGPLTGVLDGEDS